MALVSIIVPVYKAERYIGECIESVLLQTIDDWELILVDDCGEDGSMDIVKKYAKKDKRIHYIESDHNVGPMEARFKGYKLANGNYITFLDSDDTLTPKSLNLLLKKAIESNADVVSGNIEYLYSDGTSKPWNNSLSYGTDKVSVYKSILNGEFTHNLCGKIFRGCILKDFDYTHFAHFTNGEDAIFFYEIIDNIDSAVAIPDVVYYYRQNPTSSSQARLTSQKLENVIVANSLNYYRCLQYPELAKPAYCFFSKCLNEWYANGYNKDGVLDVLIRKYKLIELVKPLDMFKNLPLNLFIKQILKRHLKRYLW